MVRNRNIFWEALAIAGLLLGMGEIATAQSTQSGTGSQSQPASQSPADKSKTPDVTPLTLDAPPAPVSAEEDAAFKVFHDLSMTDANKKIESGEAFLQKYPQSRYRSPVYVARVFE
jgi:TolA-binding protein